MQLGFSNALPLEGALKMLAVVPAMLGCDLSATLTLLGGHSFKTKVGFYTVNHLGFTQRVW